MAPHPTRAVSPPLPVSTGPGSGCPARSLVGPRGMGPLTCFRMMSVACMMHLGSSPWLRARMAACSRERLRVLLQGGRQQGWQVRRGRRPSPPWPPRPQSEQQGQRTEVRKRPDLRQPRGTIIPAYVEWMLQQSQAAETLSHTNQGERTGKLSSPPRTTSSRGPISQQTN